MKSKFLSGAGAVAVYVMALLWLVITVYPLVFLLQNSFKVGTEFYRVSVWAPAENFSFHNYASIWQKDLWRFALNSCILLAASLTLTLLLASAAAYGLSRIRFAGRGVVYLLFVAGLTIPVHVTLIPIYALTTRLGIYDSLPALIGPYVASAMPMTIIVLAAFMREIPVSLEEAAHLDGATAWQVYWHVVLPVSRPALVAVAIVNSVAVWNEFVFALTLISTEAKRPLTLALWSFQGQYQTDVPGMMTAVLLSCVPVLVLYAITKDKLIEGLTAGALSN